MEYKRLAEDWREAQKAGDIDGAIGLLTEQIMDNLLAVRNAFAQKASDDPDAAFGLLFDIGEIRPEYQDMMQTFCDLGEERVDILLDGEIAGEPCAERYMALEEKVIRAMEKLDDDAILRGLCRTAKARAEALGDAFRWLLVGDEARSEAIGPVFTAYLRRIRVGRDPVATIERIQAKLAAIRERVPSCGAAGFDEAGAILREMLSVAAATEAIFRENGCNMDTLEITLSKTARFHGNGRYTDVQAVEPARTTPEKGAMARLLDLAQRGWRRSDELQRVVDRIVSGIIGSEAAEPEA